MGSLVLGDLADAVADPRGVAGGLEGGLVELSEGARVEVAEEEGSARMI